MITTGDAIQFYVAIVLTLTFLAVCWYAWEARKQANASLQMAAEAKEQRQDDLIPIIDLIFEETSEDLLIQAFSQPGEWRESRWGNLENLGKGPAFDVEFRLKLEGHDSTLKRIGVMRVGAIEPHEQPGFVQRGFPFELLEMDSEYERYVEILFHDAYGRDLKTRRVLRWHSDPAHVEIGALVLEKK